MSAGPGPSKRAPRPPRLPDIERGFIRAETINFDEMMACGGSVAAAKEKGLLRSEGKDYVVKDGDMIYFRFNV